MNDTRYIVRLLRSMLPQCPITLHQAKVIAEAQANELLHIYGVTTPAIDVDVLCALPGVSIVKGYDLSARGHTSESVWERGHWTIRISPDNTRTRRRFDLAHETKHIIDGHAKRVAYKLLGGRNRAARERAIEEIADHFAACLLMPKLWLTWAVSHGHHDLPQLAAVFMVSPIAMSKRLRNLGLSISRSYQP